MKRILLIGGLVAIAAGAAGFGFLRGGNDRTAATSGETGDIRVISKGEPVNLRDHLVRGKYTVFDYYADWCPPCRQLSPALEELARRRSDVAVRKIDIVDWSHPVARQHGVQDLPYLRIYDPRGTLLAEGDPALIKLMHDFGLHLSESL
jgi:thiol-disulfide isomerase/thioredoxin